jgi:hypothetical protein
VLQAGRVVPAGQLAELLWAPDPPPPTAPVALRNYMMRLRHALGPAGQHLIQTRPGGYVITPDGCELDLARMEQELAAARAAARDGDWQQAAVHAEASLGWWRGEPLSDVDLPARTSKPAATGSRHWTSTPSSAHPRQTRSAANSPRFSPGRSQVECEQLVNPKFSASSASDTPAHQPGSEVTGRPGGLGPCSATDAGWPSSWPPSPGSRCGSRSGRDGSARPATG